MTPSRATRQSAEVLLRRALGDDRAAFRDGQWEAIDAIVNGKKKLLVVQRTGWGKSSVYFIATRLLRDQGAGPTLIVSPLLALMRNQLEAAERLGVRAATINSTNRDSWLALEDDVLAGRVDALLVSPERLANERFVEDVLLPVASRVGLLVVDEAHCISDWGHDFRPDYRRLVAILRQLPPNVPVLGTTATANDRVVKDVEAQLAGIQLSRGPLLRETLKLQTVRVADQAERLAWLAECVPSLPGTGIVYALTKRDAEQVAGWLRERGVEAQAYYSDVTSPDFETSSAYREDLEKRLLDDELKVLVATSALGMGYDKPNLGFVIHYQAPGSVVAYYQQVGRAGRAISEAFGVLLSGREDVEIHEHFRNTAFPREADVNRVLAIVGDSEDGASMAQIEAQVNLSHSRLQGLLKYLAVESPAPVIKDGTKWRRTAVRYRLDHDKIERLSRQKEHEWDELQAYIDSKTCLMEFLGRALDDDTALPCGRCANCLGHPVVSIRIRDELVRAAVEFLRRVDRVLELPKQVPAGAMPREGLSGNIRSEWRGQMGRVLAQLGDAGWGKMVAEDREKGDIRDGLVQACAEMIQRRWRPDPAPAWVTCVPSLGAPELANILGKRLAERLQLPFAPLVKKVRANAPQRAQDNRHHRCSNLDGVYAVAGAVPRGPVLLVDDLVDSGWTMCVVATRLRRSGSGDVWPLALASSSGGE